MTQSLEEDLVSFTDDPLGFVIWAFPWGEPGSELEKFSGPEDWQRDWLIEVGRRLREGYDLQSAMFIAEPLLLARASGHGIGKSALVAWIVLWGMSTFPDTIGVVTANTENQLKTKTWVQVAYWFRLFIAKDLFKLTATALFSADPAHEKTWRLDMVPWSERNTEAFAGLHNKGRRIILIFDEASAIPDTIWEVAEGALTDSNTQILWAVFGNPTRNTGRFRECFEGGRFAHRWSSLKIDSRSVSITNKEQIDRWIEDYGEDSDFVRIRVKGEFPRVDATSFIPLTLVREAIERPIEPQTYQPIILGVDVARFGDDASVIYPRRGRDALTHLPEIYFGLSTMQFVERIAIAFHHYQAAVVMVDSGGVGGGVVDRLRQLSIPVIEVDFGAGPSGTNLVERGVRYANKRAEIWGALRDWLPTGAIPEFVHGIDLVSELVAPTYSLNAKEAILLESKKDMRRRGVASPNVADALACTFAFPVYEAPRHLAQTAQPVVAPDYDPFAPSMMRH